MTAAVLRIHAQAHGGAKQLSAAEEMERPLPSDPVPRAETKIRVPLGRPSPEALRRAQFEIAARDQKKREL